MFWAYKLLRRRSKQSECYCKHETRYLCITHVNSKKNQGQDTGKMIKPVLSHVINFKNVSSLILIINTEKILLLAKTWFS